MADDKDDELKALAGAGAPVPESLREDGGEKKELDADFLAAMRASRLLQGIVQVEEKSELAKKLTAAYEALVTVLLEKEYSYRKPYLDAIDAEAGAVANKMGGTRPRQKDRSILHVTIGDVNWEPTEDDYNSVLALFSAADAAPNGAVVATRPGVRVSSVTKL